MEEIQPADPVGKIECDPVQHNTGNDFVDAEVGLEETDKSGIQRGDQHCGDHDHKDCHRLGEVEHTADHSGDHAAHDVLSLSADIKQTGLDRKRDAKTREDDRRGADDHTCDVLGSSDHAFHQRQDRFLRRETCQQQDDARYAKTQNNCYDRQDKGVTEKFLSKRFHNSSFLLTVHPAAFA